jgi:hypothetical protein
MLASACGATPTVPSPGVVNTPPLVSALVVQGTRSKEPGNFADLNEDVPITVTVTDAESTVANLTFNWSASLGTFSGTGPRVIWKAPATASTTPVAVNVNVEIVEAYSAGGKTLQNRVIRSAVVSLHDSEKEVSEMARQFLLDFSDSSIKDIPYIMRNFEPTCYGTESETSDVSENRSAFNILEWRVDKPATTIQFGGICPYRFPSLKGDACAQVRSYWKSMARKDLFRPTGELYLKAGQTDIQTGVDQVAAMYYPTQQRWKLCDSAWNSDPPPAGAPALIRGLVP